MEGMVDFSRFDARGGGRLYLGSAFRSMCPRPMSTQKNRRVPEGIEEKARQLTASLVKRVAKRQLPEKEQILPKELSAREMLRWELRRICCGNTSIRPSWVRQEVRKWKIDDSGVNSGLVKSHLSSWKFDWIKNSTARKAVEALASGGSTSSQNSISKSRLEMEQVQRLSSDSSSGESDQFQNKEFQPIFGRNSPCSSLNFDACEEYHRQRRAGRDNFKGQRYAGTSCSLSMNFLSNARVWNTEPEQCTQLSPSTDNDFWTFLRETGPLTYGKSFSTIPQDSKNLVDELHMKAKSGSRTRAVKGLVRIEDKSRIPRFLPRQQRSCYPF